MGQRICSVEGCGKKHYGRGYCATHWSRLYKSGDIHRGRASREGPCSIEGCDAKIKAKGLCVHHYDRQRREALGLPVKLPWVERFWSRVEKSEGCWIWRGATTELGYGHVRIENRDYKAYRVSYELMLGPIPPGLVLDHVCSNPSCVNPAHLEPVTHAENLRRGSGASRQGAIPLAVLVPTVGRESLRALLEALVTQASPGDCVLVRVDDMRRYDFCAKIVSEAREAAAKGTVWRCYPNHADGPLGACGHAGRNWLIEHLAGLEKRPNWTWSCDDDDRPSRDVLYRIRKAVSSGNAPWYLFSMKGGDGSHFPGRVVPDPKLGVRIGNVGTPCIVAPVSAKARWGLNALTLAGTEHPAGYLGDGEFALALKDELGQPAFVDAVVAVIRPAPVLPTMLAT